MMYTEGNKIENWKKEENGDQSRRGSETYLGRSPCPCEFSGSGLLDVLEDVARSLTFSGLFGLRLRGARECSGEPTVEEMAEDMVST